MNYILTESQLKIIIEDNSQLLYIRRILPGKFAEVVRYVKSKRQYRELSLSEFKKRFFSIFMDVLHPYLVSKYGIDFDYDQIEEILKKSYNDEVDKLWEKYHE